MTTSPHLRPLRPGLAFALSPRIRQMIRWRRANLAEDLSRFGQFDLVLCRGLLGQLASEARALVSRQLRNALAPGGRLVLSLRDEAEMLTPVGPGMYAAAA